MAADLTKEISDQFLICKICYEVYKRPKTLNCLHTFCVDCIEKHVESERERTSLRYCSYVSRQFSCPICRTKTEVPSGGVRRLPDNFLVSNLTEVINRQKPGNMPLCDFCHNSRGEDTEATSKCIDCSKLLCKKCVEIHQRTKVTQDHSLFDIEVEKDIQCKCHPEEQVRFYCEPCQSCICVVCAFQDHKGHEVSSFTEGIDKYKASLQTLITSCKGRIDEIKGQLDMINDCEGNMKEAEANIKDMTATFISRIRARETQLLNELHNMYGSEMLSFIDKRSWLQDTLHGLQSTCNLTEIILRNQNIELLLLKNDIQEKMEMLLRPEVSTPTQYINRRVHFVPGSVALGTLTADVSGEAESVQGVMDLLPKGTSVETQTPIKTFEECQTTMGSSMHESTLSEASVQTRTVKTKHTGIGPEKPFMVNSSAMTVPPPTRNYGVMTVEKDLRNKRTQTEIDDEASAGRKRNVKTITQETNTPVIVTTERHTSTVLETKDESTSTAVITVDAWANTTMIKTSDSSVETEKYTGENKSTETVYTMENKFTSTPQKYYIDQGTHTGSIKSYDQDIQVDLITPSAVCANTCDISTQSDIDAEQFVKITSKPEVSHIALETDIDAEEFANMMSKPIVFDNSTETDIDAEQFAVLTSKPQLTDNITETHIKAKHFINTLWRPEMVNCETETDIDSEQFTKMTTKPQMVNKGTEMFKVLQLMDKQTMTPRCARIHRKVGTMQIQTVDVGIAMPVKKTKDQAIITEDVSPAIEKSKGIDKETETDQPIETEKRSVSTSTIKLKMENKQTYTVSSTKTSQTSTDRVQTHDKCILTENVNIVTKPEVADCSTETELPPEKRDIAITAKALVKNKATYTKIENKDCETSTDVVEMLSRHTNTIRFASIDKAVMTPRVPRCHRRIGTPHIQKIDVGIAMPRVIFEDKCTDVDVWLSRQNTCDKGITVMPKTRDVTTGIIRGVMVHKQLGTESPSTSDMGTSTPQVSYTDRCFGTEKVQLTTRETSTVATKTSDASVGDDNAWACAIDKSTTMDTKTLSDACVGNASICVIDIGTSMEHPSTLDTGVGEGIACVLDVGTNTNDIVQSDASVGSDDSWACAIDKSISTDSPVTSNTGVGDGNVCAVDTGTATDVKSQSDASVGGYNSWACAIDMGTSTDSPVMLDASVGEDDAWACVVDAGTAATLHKLTDKGSDAYTPTVADASVCTEAINKTSVMVETGQTEMTDTGVDALKYETCDRETCMDVIYTDAQTSAFIEMVDRGSEMNICMTDAAVGDNYATTSNKLSGRSVHVADKMSETQTETTEIAVETDKTILIDCASGEHTEMVDNTTATELPETMDSSCGISVTLIDTGVDALALNVCDSGTSMDKTFTDAQTLTSIEMRNKATGETIDTSDTAVGSNCVTTENKLTGTKVKTDDKYCETSTDSRDVGVETNCVTLVDQCTGNHKELIDKTTATVAPSTTNSMCGSSYASVTDQGTDAFIQTSTIGVGVDAIQTLDKETSTFIPETIERSTETPTPVTADSPTSMPHKNFTDTGSDACQVETISKETNTYAGQSTKLEMLEKGTMAKPQFKEKNIGTTRKTCDVSTLTKYNKTADAMFGDSNINTIDSATNTSLVTTESATFMDSDDLFHAVPVKVIASDDCVGIQGETVHAVPAKVCSTEDIGTSMEPVATSSIGTETSKTFVADASTLTRVIMVDTSVGPHVLPNQTVGVNTVPVKSYDRETTTGGEIIELATAPQNAPAAEKGSVSVMTKNKRVGTKPCVAQDVSTTTGIVMVDVETMITDEDIVLGTVVKHRLDRSRPSSYYDNISVPLSHEEQTSTGESVASKVALFDKKIADLSHDEGGDGKSLHIEGAPPTPPFSPAVQRKAPPPHDDHQGALYSHKKQHQKETPKPSVITAEKETNKQVENKQYVLSSVSTADKETNTEAENNRSLSPSVSTVDKGTNTQIESKQFTVPNVIMASKGTNTEEKPPENPQIRCVMEVGKDVSKSLVLTRDKGKHLAKFTATVKAKDVSHIGTMTESSELQDCEEDKENMLVPLSAKQAIFPTIRPALLIQRVSTTEKGIQHISAGTNKNLIQTNEKSTSTANVQLEDKCIGTDWQSINNELSKCIGKLKNVTQKLDSQNSSPKILARSQKLDINQLLSDSSDSDSLIHLQESDDNVFYQPSRVLTPNEERKRMQYDIEVLKSDGDHLHSSRTVSDSGLKSSKKSGLQPVIIPSVTGFESSPKNDNTPDSQNVVPSHTPEQLPKENVKQSHSKDLERLQRLTLMLHDIEAYKLRASQQRKDSREHAEQTDTLLRKQELRDQSLKLDEPWLPRTDASRTTQSQQSHPITTRHLSYDSKSRKVIETGASNTQTAEGTSIRELSKSQIESPKQDDSSSDVTMRDTSQIKARTQRPTALYIPSKTPGFMITPVAKQAVLLPQPSISKSTSPKKNSHLDDNLKPEAEAAILPTTKPPKSALKSPQKPKLPPKPQKFVSFDAAYKPQKDVKLAKQRNLHRKQTVRNAQELLQPGSKDVPEMERTTIPTVFPIQTQSGPSDSAQGVHAPRQPLFSIPRPITPPTSSSRQYYATEPLPRPPAKSPMQGTQQLPKSPIPYQMPTSTVPYSTSVVRPVQSTSYSYPATTSQIPIRSPGPVRKVEVEHKTVEIQGTVNWIPRALGPDEKYPPMPTHQSK